MSTHQLTRLIVDLNDLLSHVFLGSAILLGIFIGTMLMVGGLN